ncbi:unnamed protein product [Hymenolepis diminuta]|uniref:Uncharacterized protein n=1 Tax=Hymenolepis diminuta TaxID=6216 RepID=A0A564Y1Z8_HYMDI|nr:unnamed protein product [Hymenolepis diminuta]
MINAKNPKKLLFLNLFLSQVEQCQNWLHKMQVRLHLLIIKILWALKPMFLGLTLISVLLEFSEKSSI